MRLFLITLLALLLSTPVLATELVKEAVELKEEAVTEEVFDAEEETAVEEIVVETKSINEGAGLISSDQDGALPKGLWRKQYRSEINYLLRNMPANSSLRSVQQIKRNMLVSYYDASLIENDIDTKDGNDLLTIRLQKLLEMGLWEDAFKLYTQAVEDPGQNDQLAQTGILLILTQKGLSTACLEEKVLARRFDNGPFWQQMDVICAVELGLTLNPEEEFGGSSVVRAVLTDKSFKIPANNIKALDDMSVLELALLANKGRIDYKVGDNFAKTPPRVIKIFLSDNNLPASLKESLEAIAHQKALLTESQIAEMDESEANNLQNLSQKELTAQVARKLKSGINIEDDEVKKMAALSAENPQNAFYLQILTETLPRRNFDEITGDVQTPETPITNDAGDEIQEKVNFLKSLLDKSAEFSNNPANVYEKQISLTPDGRYVMPTDSLATWLEKTKQHQLVGLSLLIVLSNIDSNAYAKKSGDNPENGTVNVLKSLSTVGLIDQAHKIAKEELANLMELYS